MLLKVPRYFFPISIFMVCVLQDLCLFVARLFLQVFCWLPQFRQFRVWCWAVEKPKQHNFIQISCARLNEKIRKYFVKKSSSNFQSTLVKKRISVSFPSVLRISVFYSSIFGCVERFAEFFHSFSTFFFFFRKYCARVIVTRIFDSAAICATSALKGTCVRGPVILQETKNLVGRSLYKTQVVLESESLPD